MMKKHLLKSLLALALVLVCGNVWGADGKYVKVTSTNDLTDGQYLIVCEDQNVALDGSLATIDVAENTIEVQISNGEIAYSADIAKAAFTFTASNGSFKGTNEKYIGHSGSSNTLNSNTTAYKHTFTFDDEGNVAIKAEDMYYLRYNDASNQKRFRYYKSGQQAIQLYKYVSDVPVGPIDPTITTTNMSCSVDQDFDVSKMFKSNSDGAITYSVVEANAEDYKLDGSKFSSNVAGTYTIKASQAAVDGKFNAREATATLTVLGKYTLHIVQPEAGGKLTVKNGETELTNGCEVTIGTKLTCEVTNIPVGKCFSRFYVNYDNDGKKYKLTNPATFDNLPTEGITEATVTVTYQDSKKYTATFMCNNSKMDEVDLWENEGLVFPDVPEIEGYAFMGWTTSSTVSADGTGISYAKEGDLITANTTFYAVFAKGEEGVVASEELTNEEIISLSATKVLAYNTEKTYKDGEIDYTIYAFTDAKERHWMQLKKDKGSYVKITAPSNISKVDITITGAGNSSGGINDISKHTAFSGEVALTTSDVSYSTSSPNIAKASNLKNNVATLEPNCEVKEVYIKVSSGARIWGITVTYGNSIIYSNYTTTPSAAKSHSVTIAASGYSTLYLDYDAEVPEGVTAFYATEYDATNDQVVLTEVTSNVIAANQGVVLKGTAGTKYSFVETASATAPTANLLHGTVASEGISGLSGENGDYILKNGAFAPVSGGTLAAHKAYLHVDGRSTSTASSSIGIRFDGATMIENRSADMEEDIYFDLQGRKVENPTSGLYIVNGKKVMVK